MIIFQKVLKRFSGLNLCLYTWHTTINAPFKAVCNTGFWLLCPVFLSFEVSSKKRRIHISMEGSKIELTILIYCWNSLLSNNFESIFCTSVTFLWLYSIFWVQIPIGLFVQLLNQFERLRGSLTLMRLAISPWGSTF